MEVQPNFYEYAGSLSLNAEIPLPGQDARARVGIVLRLSNNLSCWVVTEFSVITANPFLVLSGSDLLLHHGKRPGKEKDDLSKPGNHVWTITRAADLQAMLEAYDKLAKAIGKPALFGH
ncbi:MAG: hypothetical protein WAV56_00370 [Microgenomates group bacterium]